jgi:hypothetical protein
MENTILRLNDVFVSIKYRGGGFYDEKGIKIGQWTDFDNRYRE